MQKQGAAAPAAWWPAWAQPVCCLHQYFVTNSSHSPTSPPADPQPTPVRHIEQQVRRRVLHGFSRHSLLDPDEARDRLDWVNTGFSLGASVCIASHDRAGLERQLRYCACPPFALERIEQVNADRIV